MSHAVETHQRFTIAAFIATSTLIFLAVGRPVQVLVVVGALNGLILPIGLGVLLVAAHRVTIVGKYRHPVWLTVFGVAVTIAVAALGAHSLITGFR